MAEPKAKVAEKKELDDILARADAALERKRKQQQSTEAEVAQPLAAEEEKFADIEANTFFQIMFEEGAAPEAKRDAIATELTVALEADKEENKAKLAEYGLFKEYLQFERKQMALEVIRLTDTGAFGELQQVLQDLNAGVIEFNDQLKPLTDVIDAVYDLRIAGNTMDVFREIQEDREAQEEQNRILGGYEKELGSLEKKIKSIERDIAAERENKSVLRFIGGQSLTKAARQEIARLGVDQSDSQAAIQDLMGKIKETRKDTDRETKFHEFAIQKQKLEELLDLTSEEHKARQTALVKSAESFVLTTSDRVASVLEHLEGMSGQSDALYENNGQMRHAFAILSDAEKAAGTKNQSIRDDLDTGSEEESGIQKMQRESKLEAVNDFVGQLNTAAIDTTQTMTDLTEQGGNIKTMRDTNRQQIDNTRKLHSASVSGVSERLATVLQAVSAAALNEASGGAKDSLEHMAASTRALLGKKAIENAVGMQKTADDLDKAIEQLRDFGELQDKATDLTRRTLSEIGEKMGVLEKTTRDVADGLKESIAVHADAKIHERAAADTEAPAGESTDEKPKAKRTTRAPFKRL